MTTRNRFYQSPFEDYLSFDELEQELPGEGELSRYQRPQQRSRWASRRPQQRGRPAPQRARSSGQWSTRPRRRAVRSEQVRWAQHLLNIVLGLRLPEDGIMAPATRAAIRDFQRREGLPADGIAGPPTEQALAQAGGEPAPQDGGEPAPQDGGEPTAADPDEQGELPPWPRGGREHSRWVQGALNKALGLRLMVDGLLGPATGGAIRTFQQRQGLTVDGIVGPQTEAALAASLSGGRAPGTRPGQSCEVLNGFDFDRDMLKPQHQRQLAAIARRIAAGKRQGVRVVGHTDPVGTDAYNLALGRRRAERVAAALRAALDRLKPGLGRSQALFVESRGEREPIPGSAVRSRRVEICYAAGTKHSPRAEGSCGAPQRSPLGEIALELEIDELEAETPPPTVLTRLSFYQNASNTSHRNHFQCGASRQARRLAAIASPTVGECSRRVGATPFDTGADIIRAVTAAYHCLNQRPLDAVHIFSHSGSDGIYGSIGGRGLYRAGETGIDRATGGRTLADIPSAFLANNVVFMLHGCNQANGANNFAQSLYQYLARTLSNPRVYGHTNSGCASRDNSWREYSKAHPAGHTVTSVPGYTSVGCC